MNGHRPGARLHRWRVEPSSGLARRHWAAGVPPVLRRSSSTFLRPFAPDPLRPFFALMDALTPARSLVAALGLFPAAAPWAPRKQVSLIHVTRSSDPSVSKPLRVSVSPGHVSPRRIEPRLHPILGISELRHFYAGSLHHADRIEFRLLPRSGDFLRTGRSPPAAPHPVSPRRSCSRLQVTSTWRGLSPLRSSALSGARRGGFTPPFGSSILPNAGVKLPLRQINLRPDLLGCGDAEEVRRFRRPAAHRTFSRR
jgi:hypothetical protein